MIKTIQRRLDAILHWNISFVGGFLGGYAILSHAGVFGSAQTGNLMEMASNVRFMEWEELGLRLLAMVIFACGVIASYMLTNYTNLHMRKLAIWVDAAGLGLTALLPDWFSPIAGVYPIFFCSAFQWGVYSGADGFNSATVFITNNFKQSVLGWTQYALTKDKEFKEKSRALQQHGTYVLPRRSPRCHRCSCLRQRTRCLRRLYSPCCLRGSLSASVNFR